jgi:hypothetical protein
MKKIFIHYHRAHRDKLFSVLCALCELCGKKRFDTKAKSLALACFLAASAIHAADEKPVETSVKFKLTGMFAPFRQDDLKDAAAKMSEFKLANLDYENSEVTFTYDSTKVLRGAKPDHIKNYIDNKLKEASNHTFGLEQPCTNREKLKRIEIHVGMLDCKACALGVYWMVTKVPGVEQATVGLKDGLVIAFIDPDKTNRAAIVALLKEREVTVKDP